MGLELQHVAGLVKDLLMTTILTLKVNVLAEEELALISMFLPQPLKFFKKRKAIKGSLKKCLTFVIKRPTSIIPFDVFSEIKRGTNNVRLLNSAVINQFTMLTYRQPLRAKDR